ncbi:MAG: glycine C-acetyltransferase [Deltaproteobacteria bacterium]|nr:glycine C-acetyltransferase [Deltaproteobacteria bacterium]
MNNDFIEHIKQETLSLKHDGLYKSERIITSPQQSILSCEGRQLINLCSNNYLGLANHPALKEAARAALDQFGFGMSSVRFICGTQTVHKELEAKISDFLKTEDTILYGSCFDANGGLFETLLGPEDAVISDSLNHASIIDGVRLCRAKRLRYQNGSLEELESRLREAKDCRFKMICTDGVFSMDGIIADLRAIADLADRYQALLMVDDSHSVGFIGEQGRGTHEYCGVMDRVDLLTGTLGKALGGASGGYTSGKKEIISYLRQRSRPYLFSNTLAPVIAAASLKALEIAENGAEIRAKLKANSQYFRAGMSAAGFKLVPGEHPIIPVMLGDAALAKNFADELLAEGVYVIGFSYPVVPRGEARIRTQMSAAHSKEDLERSIDAFIKVGKRLEVLPR